MYFVGRYGNLIDLTLRETARSLVLQADKGPLVVTLPSDQRLSIKKLKKALGLENASLAKPDVVGKVTGYQTGTIPIINFDVPTVVDAGILKQRCVYDGSGTWDYTLKMRPSDIVILTNATILDITKERYVEE